MNASTIKQLFENNIRSEGGECEKIFGSKAEMAAFVSGAAGISKHLMLAMAHLKLGYVDENPQGTKDFSEAYKRLIDLIVRCQEELSANTEELK